MDDAGYRLIKYSNNKGFFFSLGQLLVKSLPIVIKGLSIIGTIALILVSGGIFVHNIDYIHHLFPSFPAIAKEFVVGLIAGVLVVAIVSVGRKFFVQRST